MNMYGLVCSDIFFNLNYIFEFYYWWKSTTIYFNEKLDDDSIRLALYVASRHNECRTETQSLKKN